MGIPAGQLVRITASFATYASGAPVDPTTVALTYRNPAGTKTTVTLAGAQVIKDAIGQYHFDVDTTAAPGQWWFYWVGTGTGQAAMDPIGFTIDPVAL